MMMEQPAESEIETEEKAKDEATGGAITEDEGCDQDDENSGDTTTEKHKCGGKSRRDSDISSTSSKASTRNKFHEGSSGFVSMEISDEEGDCCAFTDNSTTTSNIIMGHNQSDLGSSSGGNSPQNNSIDHTNGSDDDNASVNSGSTNSSRDSVVPTGSIGTASRIRDRHFSFGALSSNSLKPELTDKGRKTVRFADSMGLDLVKTKTFDASADHRWPSMRTLDSQDIARAIEKLPEMVKVSTMKLLGDQPASDPGFMQKVRHRKVCLENAYMDADTFSIRGIVRVWNMDFHKAVYVRWSMNDWESEWDYKAKYVEGSNTGATDKFEFKIYTPMEPGQIIHFAVRFHCIGQQFWDNNNGQNYKMQCVTEEKKVSELPPSMFNRVLMLYQSQAVTAASNGGEAAANTEGEETASQRLHTQQAAAARILFHEMHQQQLMRINQPVTLGSPNLAPSNSFV